MYIQNSELASTFHEKEAEHIENSESEILENYREFLGWCTEEEAQKRIKGSAVVRYRQFLNDFSREYQAFIGKKMAELTARTMTESAMFLMPKNVRNFKKSMENT